MTDATSDLAQLPLPPDQIGLLEGLASTRAIRRYTSEPIPDAALRAILFAATRAPSGSNRQPFRFVVLRDGPTARAAKELIASSAHDFWSAKRVSDGYDKGSGAQADSPKARMAATMQHFVDHFAEIPVLVLPCLTRHQEPSFFDGASIFPACQNLLLAARALGYGGVFTQWHQGVEKELHQLLEIPEDVVIAGTVTLGRPAGGHGAVRRRPLPELIYEESWGQSAGWALDPLGTRFTAAGPPTRA